MIGGGVLAAVAFLISAALQLQINTTLPDLPEAGNAFVSVINTFDQCNISVSVKEAPHLAIQTLAPNTSLINDDTKEDPKQRKQLYDLPAGNTTWTIHYSGAVCNGDVNGKMSSEVTYQVRDGGTFYLTIGSLGTFFSSASTDKPIKGTGEFSLGVDLAMEEEYNGHLALCRNNTQGATKEHPCDPRSSSDFYFFLNGTEAQDFDGSTYTSPRQQSYRLADGTESAKKASIYEFITVQPGSWKLYKMFNIPKKVGQLTMSKEEVKVEVIEGVEFNIEGQGGVYLLVVTGEKDKPKKVHFFQSVKDNIIPIYWQVPQIAVMTAAEILFSITGYEFAYSQAAPSMKSIVQALWLLTVSAGDAIIVVIALMKIPNMAIALVMYAGMMLAVIAVFALLAIFYYEYNFYTDEDTASLRNFELDAGDWTVDAPKDAPSQRLYSRVDYGGTRNGGGLQNTGYVGEEEDRENWNEHF